MKTWIAREVLRRPLFCLAVLVVAVLLATSWNAWFGCIIAVCGAGLLCWSNGPVMALAASCLVGVTVVHATMAGASRTSSGHELMRAGRIELKGKVVDDPKEGVGWAAKVRLTGGAWHGRYVWWQSRGVPPVRGSLVQGFGEAGTLREPRHDGEFNSAAWLEKQGVSVVFRTKESDVRTGAWPRVFHRIRHGFRQRVTAGMKAGSVGEGMVCAVVLGAVPNDMQAVREAFRLSGALHVFSVSGLHVAMVAAIGWAMFGRMGVPRRASVPLLIALVFGYAWLTGANAPAVRAAWMTAVFLMAFWFRRKPDLLNALGLALIGALIWEPRLIHQPGVQLSYGVVAAIGLLGSWMRRRFDWMGEAELYLPDALHSWWQRGWWNLRKSVAGTFSVSAAALLGSSPLTWLHFGMVTPISLISNLLILPLVFVIMALAMGSVLVSFVSPAGGRVLNRANNVLADLCAEVASGFAAVPLGHIDFRRDRTPALRVFDLDYGARAACFSVPGEGAVMLDCGSGHGFERVVVPVLGSFGIVPDSAVLSHPAGDHCGGGAEPWKIMPIKQVALPTDRALSPAYRGWLDAAEGGGVAPHFLAADSVLKFPGDAVLEVLHMPTENGARILADNRVVVTRLQWEGWRILFHQDAGQNAEEEMIIRGNDLTADVIVVGKHQREISLSEAFLDAVRPEVIIASNPPHPREKRRDESQLAYWRGHGIAVFDQSETGGVTLRVNQSGEMEITGYVNQERVVLKPR